jgi:hypothetical protein
MLSLLLSRPTYILLKGNAIRNFAYQFSLLQIWSTYGTKLFSPARKKTLGVAPLTLLASAGGVEAVSERQFLLSGPPCCIRTSKNPDRDFHYGDGSVLFSNSWG